MTQATFNNTNYITNLPTNPNTVTMADISANNKTIHTTMHCHKTPHFSYPTSATLKRLSPVYASYPSPTHNKKSPSLNCIYTNRRTETSITTYTAPFAKQTHTHTHTPTHTHTHNTTQPLFNCKHIRTVWSAQYLRTCPVLLAKLLAQWNDGMAAEQTTETSDHLHATEA